MPAVIVMPSDAPKPKLARTAALGAEIVLYDRDREDRAAIARDGTDHRYFFNLGLALVRQGRGREARPYFEKTLQLAPGFGAAREELQKLPVDRTGR